MKKYIEVKNIKIGEGTCKICIPLIIENKDDLPKILNKLEFVEYDLIEIRIDCFSNVKNIEDVIDLLKEVRKNLKNIPIIFTFRTINEGGKTEISLEYYEKLNIEAIKSGYIDLIDVELFVESNIINKIILQAKKYNVKTIISNHNFKLTPEKDEIINILNKMQFFDIDIMKIAFMANCKKDAFNLMSIVNNMVEDGLKYPIIAISMGEFGRITRIISNIFGSCITFAMLEKSSAPGQIEANKLCHIIKFIDNLN